MQENWKLWFPIAGDTTKYCIQSIYRDNTNIRVILIPEDKIILRKMTITLTAILNAYTYLTINEESEKIQGLIQIPYKNYVNHAWNFFIITNSPYIKVTDEESYGTIKFLEYEHFCIVTKHDVLHFLTNVTPIVQIEEA